MNVASSEEEIRHFCGRATIAPAHAAIDSSVTSTRGAWDHGRVWPRGSNRSSTPLRAGWHSRETAGAYGLDIGARLRLAFRLASDGGPLQTDDPSAPG